MIIEEKYKKLQDELKKCRRMLIAYSGGVDSTFLLKAAVETLGKSKVAGCISRGPSLPESQYKRAVKLAEEMGVELITVETGEMGDPAYIRNVADRCYHCKSHLFEELIGVAKEHGYNTIACGHNVDDMSDYRPGNMAAKDFGIAVPLIEAEMSKQDIRDMSKKMDLPTAEIPASPCLASRVAYGEDITADKLRQVEEAEVFLNNLGLVEFRVRHHGEVARIEVLDNDVETVMAEGTRQRIVERLKAIGFKFVSLDMAGFKSGSMNTMLSEDEKQPYV